MKQYRFIIRTLLVFLLLSAGLVNQAWAATVTYHILTLPIDNNIYHMKDAVSGKRLEAFKVVVDQSTVELPAHYKSPLIANNGFTYYTPSDITGHGSSAVNLYDGVSSRKGVLYEVKANPIPVAEGTAITTNTAEYYVVYTYNEAANDGSIAKLDGSVNYNIGVKGKGFLSYNRGRNNRPAVIPTAKVNPEMLASPDFSYVDNPGNSIGTYWNDGNNKNSRDSTESKFFFIFKFEGKDPYHIVIRTSYARNYTFIEKNEDGDKAFVYKWYKGAALMAKTTGNAYLASDDHVRYKTTYSEGNPNPQNPSSDAKTGYFHGNDCSWGTVALLNNTSNDGYVFMGTRTVDGNGVVPGPKDNTKYYYLTFTGYNNMNYAQITSSDATKSHTMDGIYPLKKVTFKVATPFYAADPSDDHIVSVADWVSQYTVNKDPIETKYLPASLRRKYCTYTGKFYSNPACTSEYEITHFSQANYDNTEGYQVYIGYEVSSDLPFKAITPAATYTASTWAGATWYELTDDGSTQTDGLKLKYDGSSNFKNNGADGEYAKTSEFAFIGDPYELRVVLRSATSGASPSYVGATGTPPSTGTALTVSTTASEGYKWELPNDATAGSFLLRKYKDEGNWYWDAGHPSPVAISYSTKAHTYNVATANAQTVTFNVSNLGYTEGDYILVTAGGTDASQVTVSSEKFHVQSGGTASFTAAIKGRGDSDKHFTLSIQKYHSDNSTDGAVSVITVNQENTTYTSNTVQYSTENSTRVKVLKLPEKNFNYYIVDRSGKLAIKATVSQTVFSPLLGYSSIPEDIRSPFIYGETISFYSDAACTSSITETSSTDGYNIYVKYTLAHLAEKNIKLDNTQQFKVQLNKEYIYYNTSDSKTKSTPEVVANDYYSWTLEGGDPYAMKIANVGNSGKYVKVDGGTWDDNKALTFVEGIDNGSRFIAMSSLYTGVYEVLAATGTTDYYHIGRPSTTGAETKIYSISTYAHGKEELQFELAGADAVTYHLIDRSNNELLSVLSFNPRLTLPSEYVSPLVGEYYYYPTRAKATTNLVGDRITEIAQDTDEDGNKSGGKGDNHIYVTYVANDIVNFNKGQYMLKFLTPYADGYYLEDGNDKLTSDKIQAVYPYCNGDGNLNIYGAPMQEEQFNGGSSTRPRWVWYFDSTNSDPYHVRIRSKSTISYNGVNHSTYLTTYAVHFNQDTGADENKQRIVTGGTLPGVASATPMEYMVLGSKNNYKLLTTEPVAVDLNGDGDTEDTVDDVSENARRNVTSFEQYWKTYNMIKLHVLGISKTTDEYSDDPATWVVPNTPLETTYDASSRYKVYNDAHDPDLNYRDFLYQQMGWHSYDAYANATRWNGYNDKTNGGGKKVVEKIEHWYQTFDMGTGTFDIESADIPPVLVLLDRHGWEIMRRPIPTKNYPEGEELKGLRVYDSPLVDKYYFYSNATKASGCHKYTLRLNDDETERDQIKVNGVHYSSTSLGDLPPITATGVKSSDAFNDQFVVYTVKEEYENNYAPSLDKTTSPYTESGISQPYLVLQNGRFYKAENILASNHDPSYLSKPISEHTSPEGGNVYDLIVSPKNHGGTNNNIIDGSGNFLGNNFWYVKPNLNIDDEMGIPWVQATGEANETAAKNKLRLEYNEKNKSGFDPYNIQLQLVKNNSGADDGRYLTTHMTSAHLEDGILIGDYEGGSKMITLATAGSATVTSEGYDHTTLQISNQTFMAVSDANGNMQLMPRFDHTQRVDLENATPWVTHLSDSKDHAKASVDNNSSMGAQTTFFVTPKRFQYHIIDNNGREALRYKRGADFYPTITDHFKSPLAKDFIYYSGLAESNSPAESSVEAWGAATGEFKKSLTDAAMLTDAVKLLPTAGTYYYRLGMMGSFTYKSVEVTKGLSEKEITGSFAAAKVTDVDNDVYVRYSYDEDADHDGDKILLGPWFTVKLANKDLQANGTLVVDAGDTQGTGINLYAGNDPLAGGGDENDKPTTIDASAKKWQWKFLQAPTDPSSDYFAEPDPYAVQIFNRAANYTTNPSAQPSPMAVGIKVPNADNGANRFALLSHPKGGYALVVAKTYSDYDYPFLNGASMTDPDDGSHEAATTATETDFNYKTGTISDGAQLVLNDDVTHTYTYNVITNDDSGNKLAVTATQNNADALSHEYEPYLPESAQTPLLNLDDYLYYGYASNSSGTYTVIPQTKLYTLYGLYDDVVYVRYNPYDADKTPFKVPNKRNATNTGQVERNSGSVDASMNINGGLPYNIVWYNDKMMQSTDDATVSDGGSHALSGNQQHIWYFTNNDPYALKIKHKGGRYLNGTGTMVEEASAKQFMLLKKSGYDYGILQVTGTTGDDAGKKLTGYGGALTSPDPENENYEPKKFIIFGLSIHNLIYHLVIAKSCPNQSADPLPTDQYVDIPYSEKDENGNWVSGYSPADNKTKRIYGTTQRDLTSVNDGDGTHYAGEKYQLGSTLSWNGEAHTYSYDAGSVSIGDDLVLPTVFYRPNCLFDFYVEGIYNGDGAVITAMENKYKGLQLTGENPKLMSDEELIDQTVVVNVVYKFNPGLETNAGGDFVTEMKAAGKHYLWYTFETADATPQLAHYTHVRGMRAESGRALHYTNDYLWSPLGDPYGFKSYNRYIYKNNGAIAKVLTSTSVTVDGTAVVMEEPGQNSCTSGNEIYELLPGSTPESGNFRVHPLLNTDNTLFLRIKEDVDPAENGKLILSDDTPVQEWTYGLGTELLNPYYQGAGNVGGLNATGKTAYENAQTEHASDPFQLITELQKICYNNTNIVPYSAGYYRLCNQPGASSLSTQRYASGYLHEIEKTAGTSSTPIPMHFYSKVDVTGSFAGDTNPLTSGFTETAATRGEIPIPATEYDPSTIFQFTGGATAAKMQTQGLYVKGVYSDEHNGYAKMTSNSEDATSFHVDDIGGAVVLIYNLDGSTRRYINYGQNASIYDLKYYENVDVDGSKWCMEPASTQNLKVATNNGGDGYYYATFYAPFDVQLPADALDGTKTYNAYTCKTWNNAGLHPTAVPAATVNAVEVAEGKFVPANTPVILRVKDESGSVTLTLPTASPTASSITTDLIGTYLEQLLALDAAHDVYTMGVPFSSSVDKDADYATTGNITAPLPEFETRGVGFYINATPNKEADPSEALWKRNNRYVLHNKIYYRAGEESGASAPQRRGPEFVPVIFDDEEAQQELNPDGTMEGVGDGCIYDLMGRKVATREQVEDGSWKQRVATGIYILNGRKFQKK